MKIVCLRQELTGALATVGKAVAARPNTPILAGIYIKSGENSIEMRSTDNELSVIATIPASVDEGGEIVVSGRYLQDVSRSLPDDEVTIERTEGENIVKIRSGGSNFTLLSMEPNDFPDIKRIEDSGFTLKLKNTELKSLIRKTSFACATRQDARPIFTGCLIEIEGNTISMVATNTHRLSINRMELSDSSGIETSESSAPPKKLQYIVPKRVLEELMQAFSDVPEDVNVTFGGGEISFEFGSLYVASRLIEGQFPDYNRAVPKEFRTRATISITDFLSAVNRVSLITRATSYNYATLEFSGSVIRMTSNNPDIGRAEENVPAVIDGPDVKISFNVEYIVDMLKSIDGSKFYFQLIDTLKPAVVREESGDEFLCVVTPIRTPGS